MRNCAYLLCVPSILILNWGHFYFYSTKYDQNKDNVWDMNRLTFNSFFCVQKWVLRQKLYYFDILELLHKENKYLNIDLWMYSTVYVFDYLPISIKTSAIPQATKENAMSNKNCYIFPLLWLDCIICIYLLYECSQCQSYITACWLYVFVRFPSIYLQTRKK